MTGLGDKKAGENHLVVVVYGYLPVEVVMFLPGDVFKGLDFFLQFQVIIVTIGKIEFESLVDFIEANGPDLEAWFFGDKDFGAERFEAGRRSFAEGTNIFFTAGSGRHRDFSLVVVRGS